MKIFSRINLLLLSAVFAAGCATHRPEVDTWRDARFSVTTTNTMAMTERPDPTPEDATLGRMLMTEMQREGFVFVPAAQADYLLTYVTENLAREQHYLHDDVSREPMMTTPQTSEKVIEASYTPKPSVLAVDTFVFYSKGISLYLYTNPQKSAAGLSVVWRGTIDAGKSLPLDQEPFLIRALLNYFGQIHSGPVRLTQ